MLVAAHHTPDRAALFDEFHVALSSRPWELTTRNGAVVYNMLVTVTPSALVPIISAPTKTSLAIYFDTDSGPRTRVHPRHHQGDHLPQQRCRVRGQSYRCDDRCMEHRRRRGVQLDVLVRGPQELSLRGTERVPGSSRAPSTSGLMSSARGTANRALPASRGHRTVGRRASALTPGTFATSAVEVYTDTIMWSRSPSPLVLSSAFIHWQLRLLHAKRLARWLAPAADLFTRRARSTHHDRRVSRRPRQLGRTVVPLHEPCTGIRTFFGQTDGIASRLFGIYNIAKPQDPLATDERVVRHNPNVDRRRELLLIDRDHPTIDVHDDRQQRAHVRWSAVDPQQSAIDERREQSQDVHHTAPEEPIREEARDSWEELDERRRLPDGSRLNPERSASYAVRCRCDDVVVASPIAVPRYRIAIPHCPRVAVHSRAFAFSSLSTLYSCFVPFTVCYTGSDLLHRPQRRPDVRPAKIN